MQFDNNQTFVFQSDDETEKADSTKDEKEKINEAVKETFGDRLASFFRINKSFNMDDEKVNDEDKKSNDDELQKVIYIFIYVHLNYRV